jgi:hypothetical protein
MIWPCSFPSLSISDTHQIHTVKSRKLAEENKYLERAEFVHEQQAKGRPMEIYFAEEVWAKGRLLNNFVRLNAAKMRRGPI